MSIVLRLRMLLSYKSTVVVPFPGGIELSSDQVISSAAADLRRQLRPEAQMRASDGELMIVSSGYLEVARVEVTEEAVVVRYWIDGWEYLQEATTAALIFAIGAVVMVATAAGGLPLRWGIKIAAIALGAGIGWVGLGNLLLNYLWTSHRTKKTFRSVVERSLGSTQSASASA